MKWSGQIVHARVRIKTSVKCSGQIVHARVRIETSVKWSITGKGVLI